MTKNIETTAAQIVDTEKTAVAKPVLTLEEKKAKRNEYARAYYAAHKETMKAAVKKCQAAKRIAEGKTPTKPRKIAKHVIAPAAKPVKAIKPAKISKETKAAQKDLAKTLKKLEQAEKLVQKNALLLKSSKDMVKLLKADVKAKKAAVKDAVKIA